VKKQEFYKRIKIAGMISFIPVILAAGPLAGFFLGSYLEKQFGFGSYISLISIAMGIVASVTEVIRIIRSVSRIEEKK
jgi:hypothetical protein